MKKAILTLAITAISFGFVNAQGTQVSNAAFQLRVNKLSVAISLKNTANETTAFNDLDELMRSQISFLTSSISVAKTKLADDIAKAEADTKAAEAEKTTAEADLAKAEAAINSGNGSKANSDVQKAEDAINKAKANIATAHQKREDSVTEEARIDARNGKLVTEKDAYNTFQPLKSNILANKDKIMDNLKLFASTLE